MLEQTQGPSGSALPLEPSVSGRVRRSGKEHVCCFPLLPAVFRAGNFLSLLWVSYMG